MSVIAKLNLLAVRAFGGGSLYEMSCVCQDDLMAMYAKSDEDKLFTNASPWGEARLNTSLGVEAAHPAPMSQFYAMLVHKDEPGFHTEPKGTLFVCPARIRSEEHTSELQSLMRISYAVFCLKKNNTSRH